MSSPLLNSFRCNIPKPYSRLEVFVFACFQKLTENPTSPSSISEHDQALSALVAYTKLDYSGQESTSWLKKTEKHSWVHECLQDEICFAELHFKDISEHRWSNPFVKVTINAHKMLNLRIRRWSKWNLLCKVIHPSGYYKITRQKWA